MAKKDRIEYLDYGLFDKEVAEIVETALHNTTRQIPLIKVYTTCIVVPFGVHDVKITVTDDKKVGIVYVADTYIQSFYTEGEENLCRKAMYEYFDQEFFQDGIDKYQTMRFDSISQFKSWFTFEKLFTFFKVLNKSRCILFLLLSLVNQFLQTVFCQGSCKQLCKLVSETSLISIIGQNVIDTVLCQ